MSKKYISKSLRHGISNFNSSYKVSGPYEGVVKKLDDDSYRTIPEAVRFFGIPKLIGRVDDWAICDDGIYSLIIHYVISRDRIDENDWEERLEEKSWVNINSFRAAKEEAKKLWNA